MPAEVFQQVCAALNGGVKVEPLHAAGAAGDKAVALGEYHCGFVVGLHQTGRHNAHHAFVPGGVIDNGHVFRGQRQSVLHHFQRFLGDFPVDGLALVVVVVDLLAYPDGGAVVRSREQLHRQPAAFHTPRRIDARTDFEDDIVNADMPGLQFGQVDHGQEAFARVLVQAFEAEVRQDAVFAGHGHQVRGDGDHLQIQQRLQQGELQAVFLDIALGQFETHTTTAKVVEGIVAVFPLGVQDGHGAGKFVLRQVVIADDNLNALGAGIFHFVDGLDPAVQRDNQADPVVRGPVQRLVRQAVAFVVAIRNVKLYFGRELFDKGIDLCYSRGAVYVIVSVHQDFFTGSDGRVQAFHRLVHVCHEEGVMEVLQAGTEEGTGLLKGGHAALDKQRGQHPVYAELCGKLFHAFLRGSVFQGPLSVNRAHSLTKITILRHFCKYAQRCVPLPVTILCAYAHRFDRLHGLRKNHGRAASGQFPGLPVPGPGRGNRPKSRPQYPGHFCRRWRGWVS